MHAPPEPPDLASGKERTQAEEGETIQTRRESMSTPPTDQPKPREGEVPEELPESPKFSEQEEVQDQHPHEHEHERRRTRPRPSPAHKASERASIVPHTLREVLEGVTVQHVAMENWSRKRLVLVGSGQTLERVCLPNKFLILTT